jgi:hypothetical protein
MKKTVLLILAILFVASSVQAIGEFQKRLTDSKVSLAEVGSYTYIANIDVSSTNLTLPDSVKILGICIDTIGSIRVSVPGKDSVLIKSPDFFCYPAVITKIYKLGTDSLLRSNHITIFGHKK